MASVNEVRTYLAYWFQLGKPVIFHRQQSECLPNPIFQGNRFSTAFEQCWQRILNDAANCHLRGTNQTVADLLAADWDIVGCARCDMPIPMPIDAVSGSPCPCYDLPSWPNDEMPQPRMAVDTHNHLSRLRDRLTNSVTERDRLRSAYAQSPNLPQSNDISSSPLSSS
ncbi:MAG: hypothetical protein AAGH78_10970 [Cyanobacteria bacterium P01_H01_bin.58]